MLSNDVEHFLLHEQKLNMEMVNKEEESFRLVQIFEAHGIKDPAGKTFLYF